MVEERHDRTKLFTSWLPGARQALERHAVSDVLPPTSSPPTSP